VYLSIRRQKTSMLLQVQDELKVKDLKKQIAGNSIVLLINSHVRRAQIVFFQQFWVT